MTSRETRFLACTPGKLIVGVARIELTSDGPKPPILTVIPYPVCRFLLTSPKTNALPIVVSASAPRSCTLSAYNLSYSLIE